MVGNMVGETYIHGSVGSVLGAFAVSLLGSIYTRLWNGYAFAAMVPGVLLLVPVRNNHHISLCYLILTMMCVYMFIDRSYCSGRAGSEL